MKSKDLLYLLPLSLAFGAFFAFWQAGIWWIGFASFSFLFLLSFLLLKLAQIWTGGGKFLAWMVVLAFGLRLFSGVSLHLGLPLFGHADSDVNRAGYVFTDSYIRDGQAWKLASSDRPIWEAFSRKFSSDQYGGLLAFSAFVYRYLSPDAQRPLLLVLLSAFIAALGIPFLWMGTRQVFGERVASAAAWIFALYPESILLGSSAMREPYLLTFSAMAFYGFVEWFFRAPEQHRDYSEWSALRLRVSQEPLNPPLREETNLEGKRSRSAWIWLALGLLGMLLVSPAVALATLVIFAGWMFFTNERRSFSWKSMLIFVLIFTAGLLILSASLNRSGQFDDASPFRVINDWLRLTVKWDAYQLERDSGWIQQLFDDMPEWMRLPFVAAYGILQPVLPAALVAPTVPVWKAIYILRALGWYALLPMLILSIGAAAGLGRRPERVEGSGRKRNILLWLALLAWTWILLAALRGGGDAWDNPRYRTILLVWLSILAGQAWVWWRETRSGWFGRVVWCEVIFLLVFSQWYASRYLYWGGKLDFEVMVSLIAVSWAAILGLGWWLDKKRA